MNNILGLESGALIKLRGAYGTQLRLRVPGLWLTVPLFPSGGRGGGGTQGSALGSSSWALAGRARAGQQGTGQHDKGNPSPLPAHLSHRA